MIGLYKTSIEIKDVTRTLPPTPPSTSIDFTISFDFIGDEIPNNVDPFDLKYLTELVWDKIPETVDIKPKKCICCGK